VREKKPSAQARGAVWQGESASGVLSRCCPTTG
jgi:hypothetical protein